MLKIFSISLLIQLFLICSGQGGPLIRSADVKQDIPFEENLVLNKIDNDTDLILSTHRVSEDNGRFSLTYKFYPHFQGAMDISTMEVNYSKKLNYCWLEFMGARTVAKFSKISSMNGYLGADSDKQNNSEDEMLVLGIGISYRSTFIQKVLEELMFSEDIFETTSALLTYQKFDEKNLSYSFKGPGIQADFGIHKRAAKNFHYGFKFSYNLSTVKKSKTTEHSSSSSRSLVLSWIAVGIDIGFYM